ncbi:MAG: hypothetical protein E7460_05880 [Ruminococcaceae bacterium]|nr:hypothetical protein [Oscillospiraceae bacterium]
MDGKTTVGYLQKYIASKDYHPELKETYFLKLSEEVGELAQAMRKDRLRRPGDGIKGTIDEELWDIMYYLVALANCYGIDLEEAIRDKEAINNVKYNTGKVFEENR